MKSGEVVIVAKLMTRQELDEQEERDRLLGRLPPTSFRTLDTRIGDRIGEGFEIMDNDTALGSSPPSAIQHFGQW